MKDLMIFLKRRGHKTKYAEEENFWTMQIKKYVEWYNRTTGELYGTPNPAEGEKTRLKTLEHSAMLTWFNIHQKPKYPYDLKLKTDAFKGLKLLDIGSGPFPSAEAFVDCELYCLDPLLPSYIKAGYPIHYYKPSTRFIYGYSEAIPVEDGFFDAVISVNSIDHFDDIYLTAMEIKRVLKPDGLVRMHVHYHKRTKTEPLELNDTVMSQAFGWCERFKKIDESSEKMGSKAGKGESYALWSNF